MIIKHVKNSNLYTQTIFIGLVFSTVSEIHKKTYRVNNTPYCMHVRAKRRVISSQPCRSFHSKFFALKNIFFAQWFHNVELNVLLAAV